MPCGGDHGGDEFFRLGAGQDQPDRQEADPQPAAGPRRVLREQLRAGMSKAAEVARNKNPVIGPPRCRRRS
jgi:hypothetical protein